MTNRLVDMLKVATGRKLSKRDIDRAKKGYFENYGKNSELTLKTVENGGHYGVQIVKKRLLTTRATTEDASIRGKYHTGYYFTGTNTSFYDEGGFLLRREIVRHEPLSQIHKRQAKIYPNPGSFFGKKEDRYEYVKNVSPIGMGLSMVIEGYPQRVRDTFDYPSLNHRASVISQKSGRTIKQMRFKK